MHVPRGYRFCKFNKEGTDMDIWYKLRQYGVRGNILNVIKSMYSNVKSQMKCNNTLSDAFFCNLSVRQGEPFLFSIYLNDLEQMSNGSDIEGIYIGIIKIGLLSYTDDIILFAKSADELQHSLNMLFE